MLDEDGRRHRWKPEEQPGAQVRDLYRNLEKSDGGLDQNEDLIRCNWILIIVF